MFAFLLTGLHAQSIYVFNKSGIQNAFPLASIKTITFSGARLNVNIKDGNTISTSLSDIKFLTFSPLTEVINPTITEGNVNIFPNPVHDLLNLSFTKENSRQSTEITICTIDGKIIYTNRLQEQSILDFQINTSAWSHGIYFLRINSGNEVISRKIIKN